MSKIEINVKGADILAANLDKFSNEIKLTMQAAGQEAARNIVETEGLKTYPPKTEANMPGRYSLKTHRKMGYYVRGTGPVTPGGKQLGGSEDYKNQFYAKPTSRGTLIGNCASYAKYLAGEKEQATQMAKYGWRKLIDVAMEKLGVITTIFNKWVDYTIRKLGL